MHQTFQLRVVAHARDANKDVPVLLMDAQAPAASEPTPSSEVSAEPVAPPEVPGEAVAPESTTAPLPTVLRSSRPEISVHAIGSLGFTSLEVAGYEPTIARHSHLTLGVRLRVARPDAWWAVEAAVSGEWLDGAMTYIADSETNGVLTMRGPWMRAEVGMRARLDAKWSPSAYAGLGLQAHLRRTENALLEPGFSETMPRGAVLVLGFGLERRVSSVLLGLDFQVREGGPDGYHSAAVLWTIGYLLESE